ncbi:hypothetical protein AcV5_009430 [Taiwanofungus camphoratus]|nr:hypothetical protein AcV5_009430 [Antrodia cinnamomea]
MPVCKGCNQEFSQCGYASHLQQTTKLTCIVIRQHEEDFGAAAPFEGDFYGDYIADDFVDLEDVSERDEHNTHSDEDDEENKDENDIVFTGWEPPPVSPLPFSRYVHNEEMDSEAEDHPHLNSSTRQQIEENARKKTFVVSFPGGLAGQPVSQTRQASTYEMYKTTVDHEGANAWAPFTSHLDWEFARWAKLQGPGSTSVDELLKVEGDYLACHIRIHVDTT